MLHPVNFAELDTKALEDQSGVVQGNLGSICFMMQRRQL